MYGGRYLCGFKYVKNEAASLGNETHTVAELYHKHGKRPDRTTLAGRLFLLALPYSPQPGVGKSEGEFVLKVGGVAYKGLIDHIDGNHVTDYKTTTNIKKLALKTKGDFLKNPQAIIYAVKALVSSKSEEVKLTWIYIQKEGKLTEEEKAKGKKPRAAKAEAFSVVLSRAEIDEAFGAIVHPVAEKLVQLRLNRVDKKAPEKEKLAKFFSLVPNFNSCYKFGRCQFYDLCYNEDGEEMTDTSALAEKLKASLAKSKGVNPPENKEAQKTEDEPVGKGATTADYKAAVDAKRETKPTAEVSDEELGKAVRVVFKALFRA